MAASVSVILVTSADAAHFDFAREMIESVRRFPSLAPIVIGMLDVGLTDEQRGWLKMHQVRIATAQWELEGPPPANMPRGFLAMLSRPFLPKYFPGFDVLVYLDSDTWVQQGGAITDLASAAMVADIAIAPEIHPSFSHLYDPRHGLREHHRNAYAAAFGQDGPMPADNAVLNVGVFAARRDSRVWPVWGDSLAKGLERVRQIPMPEGQSIFVAGHPALFFIEQNALNHAFYQKTFKLMPMSPLYNFICSLAQPMWDPDSRKLVEPSLPYTPIQIVHLSDAGKKARSVMDRYGKTHERGLRWPDWRGMIKDD